jgi:transposase
MRGNEAKTDTMFVYLSPESFVPKEHPLRSIRTMVDAALAELDADFNALYSHTGRPSIPPEQLLKALLLQALFSVRSNRLLVEQINYNILFRWFVGLALDEKVWDHSSFSTNLERLIDAEVSRLFLAKIVKQARKAELLSNEHFSVDGTLIEAWASIKSFRPKDGDPKPPVGHRERDFHGEKLSNETHLHHRSRGAALQRAGQGIPNELPGACLMENRNGLIVDGVITHATGTAEREAAVEMVADVASNPRITVAGDKGYDTHDFVRICAGFRRPLMSLRTPSATAARLSTDGRRDTKVTRSACASANESKRSSAGSRPSATCARRATVARRRSTGTLSWPSQPTTWSECETSGLLPPDAGRCAPESHENRPKRGEQEQNISKVLFKER